MAKSVLPMSVFRPRDQVSAFDVHFHLPCFSAALLR
jgi:hypothetical protein